MKRLIIGLFAGYLAFAQTASIYEFTDKEAAEGSKLYQTWQDAEHSYHDWERKMALKARGVEPDAPDDGRRLVFSPDFKHAIWDNRTAIVNSNNLGWGYCVDGKGMITKCP